ncbi:hypothetical protein H4582DRAFT_2053998 [Lactarius indigo]|nr:hypothetical protein H4582DRAFT_2053998 [Lactarius indigo]
MSQQEDISYTRILSTGHGVNAMFHNIILGSSHWHPGGPAESRYLWQLVSVLLVVLILQPKSSLPPYNHWPTGALLHPPQTQDMLYSSLMLLPAPTVAPPITLTKTMTETKATMDTISTTDTKSKGAFLFGGQRACPDLGCASKASSPPPTQCPTLYSSYLTEAAFWVPCHQIPTSCHLVISARKSVASGMGFQGVVSMGGLLHAPGLLLPGAWVGWGR